jgi:low temperature requirement protein LtrA
MSASRPPSTEPSIQRVSTVELFFDLVFVFTLTQLTSLVLAAAFVRPAWDWPLWVAAVAVLLIATARRPERDFQLSPAHFVERHGLLMIVALGESVVAVGVGAQGLPIDTMLILAAVLALFLSASVWLSIRCRSVGRRVSPIQQAARRFAALPHRCRSLNQTELATLASAKGRSWVIRSA